MQSWKNLTGSLMDSRFSLLLKYTGVIILSGQPTGKGIET